MTLRLVPIAPDEDMETLVGTLAPSFGGDEAVPGKILAQTQAMLRTRPRPDPWGSYIVWEAETPVGTCAFKDAPNDAGQVEIAYMTFPLFEGQGHATAMAGHLVEIARSAGADAAIAHTLSEENASNRALRRNGFIFGGNVTDPEDGEVWRWEKRVS